MNHARHRQKNGIIAEETISLSDSMTKGQNNRRRTMPAEVNLGRSMRGRRVTPSDSHVMTVNSGKEKEGEEEVESELGAAGIIERPRATQLPPMNPKPRLPPWPPTAPKSRFQRPTRPPPPPPPPRKPELPPKPNLPPAVVIERGKRLGREKFREIPFPDDDHQSGLKADFGDADDGENDVLGESTTTVNTTTSSLAALFDGEGVGGGCWTRTKMVYHFFLETKEYADPHQFGWRIKFRRAFLFVGVLMFTYLTVYTAVSTQNFSSKEEIQQLLDYAGANLTWPDSGSVLDVSETEHSFSRPPAT